MAQEDSSDSKVLYRALVRFFRSRDFGDPEAEAGRRVCLPVSQSTAKAHAPEETWRVILDAARNDDTHDTPPNSGSARNAAPVSSARRFRELPPEDREFLFYYLRALPLPAAGAKQEADPRLRFLGLLRTMFEPPVKQQRGPNETNRPEDAQEDDH